MTIAKRLSLLLSCFCLRERAKSIDESIGITTEYITCQNLSMYLSIPIYLSIYLMTI